MPTGENWWLCNTEIMRLPEPGTNLLVALVAVGAGWAVLSAMLAGSGVSGLTPCVPAAAGGVWIVVKWFINRSRLGRRRVRSDDLDRELRELIERGK